MDLTRPLPPLTRPQRTIFLALALFCGATRFLAMARSLWDWDEALFCLGMRSYDVTNHHPHPPGFPVYIAAAKILRTVIPDDFRAVQAVNLLAAVFVFPAVFLLARELRLRFETASVAAALCAFFPNVWFFGGTAFSDVPSIVLVVYAVAMLLRGCRERKAYWIGTLLLALAIGIRPQNLLVGLFPGLLATYHRARQSWRDVVVAALIGIVLSGASFGAAIAATGSYKGYMDTVRTHSEYISRVDSFRSPDRPPLWRISDRFFLKQYQAPVMNVLMSFFVLISVVGAVRSRDRSILLVSLAFLPLAVMAWLMLDRFSISRFSIGYCPMFAILGADGIARACWKKRWAEPVVGAVLVAVLVVWTLPALNSVRREVSPPVAAVLEARKTMDPRRDQLFVGFSLTPFVEYFAPGIPFQGVMDERAMPMSADGRKPYLLAEIDRTRPYGRVFERERGHLWNIARRHYFVVALEPLHTLPQFVSGWYAPERGGTAEWRWMKGHSETRLPPGRGPMYLRLMFDVPSELLPSRPVVTIAMNGTVLARFTPAEGTVTRDFEAVAAAGGAPNTLQLDVDRVINPARQHVGDDARDLGLLVRWISWGVL